MSESYSHDLIYSTVRIEIQTKNNEVKVGTGFIYKYQKEGKFWHFLVTARHVVDKAIRGEIQFHRGDFINDKNVLVKREFFSVNLNNLIFFYIPDSVVDIAICNISKIFDDNSHQMYINTVSEIIIPDSIETDGNISKIEDIVFIGYPIDLWDKKNKIPIVRRGITATPIHYDFEDKPIFIIDATVFPGSSGSPVFIYRQGVHLEDTLEYKIGEKVYFMGILASSYAVVDHKKLEISEIPSSLEAYIKIENRVNLGIVYKEKAIKFIIQEFFKKYNK